MCRLSGPSLAPEPAPADLLARIGLALSRCADDGERARLALTILLSHAGASHGVLFSLGGDGPYCAAQQGEVALPEAWSQQIAGLLAQKLQEAAEAATQTEDDELPSCAWIDNRGRTYQPVLLAHTERDLLLFTGVAVIATREDGKLTRPDAAAAAISRYFAGLGSMSLSLILE